MSVVIETTLGDVTVDLFVNERPQTCLNFVKLCKIKYYNLCLFHSVNSNFCAQTGDPTGKGDGGESIHGLLNGAEQRLYQGESQPKLKHDRAGLLSMVSHGNGLLGSQFIFTLSSELSSLDGEHCVFGEIVEGQELLLKLNETITDDKHRPYQDIRITHTVILEDPFPDPQGFGEPPASPVPPSTKDVAFSRIPADEPIADTCTQDELDEMVQAREAAARATILEMVGDLPSADVAPPENVLFVCKLNPVTTDHDLSIIFSRFGKVKNCEVIRDSVTGDSLQYAFVEFDNPKSCEEAYFKMDNVLIDDKRIHVDFSQSVAKWRGKGKGVEMLGPPPKGGWGNKSRNYGRDGERLDRGRLNNNRNYHNTRDYEDQGNSRRYKSDENNEPSNTRNGKKGSPAVINKVTERKEVQKKKRRRSPSSSSSSSTETSDSSSSSDSSDSEPVRKKAKRKSDKVLVVVKAPRGRSHKKARRNKSKSKKYDSDSESDDVKVKKKKKKNRKKSSSDDSSSTDNRKSKKTKKKSYSSEEDSKVGRKKKKKGTETSSGNSSEEEVRKRPNKKKAKKRKARDSSSDDDRRKKKKKTKGTQKRKSTKKKRRPRSESDSSSSSD